MEQTDQLNALLNTDLGDVPTTRPLLNGLAKLRVKSMEVEPNNAGDGHNLVCTFMLVEPMTSTDGRAVQPGFPVFHNISLKITEKYNPKENLARLREALTGTHSGTFAPKEQYIGLECMAQLRPELSEQYGDKTVIARFVKRG